MPAIIIFRPDRAIRVATSFVAHNVCSKSFVSGLDPQTVFSETTDRDGIRRLRWGLNYHLDRTGQTVDASLAGLFGSRAAFHEGLGCVLLHGPNEPYLAQERHRRVEDAEKLRRCWRRLPVRRRSSPPIPD